MMNKKDYYSTGEASQLLNISRATVSRKFDAGIFQGRKNPITGERLISHESLVSFMNQYNIPVPDIPAEAVKHILLGSPDRDLGDLLRNLFLSDRSLNLLRIDSGYDTLIECSRKPPDLLIMDERLPDIDCRQAVNALNREITGRKMKIMLISEKPIDLGFEEIHADAFILAGAIEPRVLRNKIYSLLDIQKEQPPENKGFTHKREWPRIQVKIPADIEFYAALGQADRKQGQTVVENISMGGALLSDITVENNSIPLGNITFTLKIDKPPLSDFETECKITRLRYNGSADAGVEFINLAQEQKNRISQLLH